MKWNDIPKFISDEYIPRINLSIVEYAKYVDEWIEKYNLEMYPEFQRGHVWTEEQQSKYIEFILRCGKTGKDFYFNHSKTTDKFVCVDGLQRTTAIQKFVSNNLKAFGQYFDEFGESGRLFQSPTPYSLTIYTNNLETEREVLQWYIDMNSGGTPHTNEEIERVRKMLENC